MFSGWASKDKSCGNDVFSAGASNDKSCRKHVFSGWAAKDMSCRKDVFSAGTFKDMSCGKNVFSGWACEDAGRRCPGPARARRTFHVDENVVFTENKKHHFLCLIQSIRNYNGFPIKLR